ncbi:uncharacterized protein FOMMEDRAFT_21604 [Fomitiporia mediterranea MF3/22]|uniref:uncharacterized protein n=1 Tax=Fomitiporia mediterranea (strain MF3/22) TaxID=694068 RepID=UPI0004407D44|nr:uncharacterized protein FOMMEDRAFT_21604 [Fomitiporia mediterranea MF3/22]EJD01160.1 hypothetical protein FOMMEDRAFT_21604 [Fomitiporia mediterranea MF3/22]
MPGLRVQRYFLLGIVFIAAAIVLGLAANFANLFLPHIHRPYTIFTLVVPSVTILVSIFIAQRSTLLYDAVIFFVLDVLWLSLAAWSSDVIGHVECFSLGGTQPTKTGSMSAQQYCYEMKSIMAFSWFNFGILLISLLLTFKLASSLTTMGNPGAWFEDTAILPGFGASGGYGYGGYGGYGYGGAQAMFSGNGQMPYVIQQAPGHSVVIQPNPGGVPTVSQVPGAVSAV